MSQNSLIAGSARSICWQAVGDTLPLAIAVIPWGILTGALGIQVGLTPWQTQCMSLLVFGGAVQLSGLSMIAGAASPAAIYGSSFVISSRHLLYSIVFRQYVLSLTLPKRVAMGFVLTDEMFAVSQAHTQRTGAFSALFALVSGFTFYVIWNVATAAGIIAGDSIHNLDQLGLDFAIAATFIAMTFSELRRLPVVIAMLVSGSLAVLLKPTFSDSYIVISSLIGMLAAYCCSGMEER